ncbi:MAG TPA: hypothetical protein DDW45_06260 [Gammaproteobacteria bacterium]|nr:hypothetical protein [Gammaproteobacteria bacterium]
MMGLVSRQLPTANCQLPTANCQLPTANYQFSPFCNFFPQIAICNRPLLNNRLHLTRWRCVRFINSRSIEIE